MANARREPAFIPFTDLPKAGPYLTALVERGLQEALPVGLRQPLVLKNPGDELHPITWPFGQAVAAVFDSLIPEGLDVVAANVCERVRIIHD